MEESLNDYIPHILLGGLALFAFVFFRTQEWWEDRQARRKNSPPA